MEDFVSLGRLLNEYENKTRNVSRIKNCIFSAISMKNFGFVIFWALYIGVALGGGYLLGMLENKIWSWLFIILTGLAFITFPFILFFAYGKRATKMGVIVNCGKSKISFYYCYKLLKKSDLALTNKEITQSEKIARYWEKARALYYINTVSKKTIHELDIKLDKANVKELKGKIDDICSTLTVIEVESDRMFTVVSDLLGVIDAITVNSENQTKVK